MRTPTSNPSAFRPVPAQPLPIHAAAIEGRAVLYAPRQVCVLGESDLGAALRHIVQIAAEPCLDDASSTACRSGAWHAAIAIVRAARRAAREVREASVQEFAPECLTVFVNNRCNMRCSYCYSHPGADEGATVTVEGVGAAARLVASACAAGNRPLTLAIHGGGEPTLDATLIDRVVDRVRQEAGRLGIGLTTYIATNGASSEQTALWLAEWFDLVGVSCDGPPDIQDRHRPGRDGRPLSDRVARTMGALRRLGRPFHVRVTISRDTLGRQAEIVSYLADHFAPNEIRLEPVYANPSGETAMESSCAAAFVDGFLAAQSAGASRAIPVTTSISRPSDVYGPYCNVLRRVLNLVPGDVATGCFLDSRPDDVARRGRQLGAFDAIGGGFRLCEERIASLIARCSGRPMGCGDCLCGLQCTYGCPDRCILEASGPSLSRDDERPSFRCEVNRMLMERMIRDAADRAWASTPEGACRDVRDAQAMLSVGVYRNPQPHQVAR